VNNISSTIKVLTSILRSFLIMYRLPLQRLPIFMP
jgi:hypothetical protein